MISPAGQTAVLIAPNNIYLLTLSPGMSFIQRRLQCLKSLGVLVRDVQHPVARR